MQNHLEILALFAMGTRVSLAAEDFRNEKVKGFRSMRIQLEHVIVGEYNGHNKGGKSYLCYTDGPTVKRIVKLQHLHQRHFSLTMRVIEWAEMKKNMREQIFRLKDQ